MYSCLADDQNWFVCVEGVLVDYLFIIGIINITHLPNLWKCHSMLVLLEPTQNYQHEIVVHIMAKELELGTTAVRSSSTSEQFDITRHIRFVPPFQETEPDNYFLHFEKFQQV